MTEFRHGNSLTKFKPNTPGSPVDWVRWFDAYWTIRSNDLGLALQWGSPSLGINGKVWRSEARIVGMNENDEA